MSEFGKAVREARHALGLTQVQLGRLVGYHWKDSGQAISRIERGCFKPRYNKLKAFAEALGIDRKKLVSLKAYGEEIARFMVSEAGVQYEASLTLDEEELLGLARHTMPEAIRICKEILKLFRRPVANGADRKEERIK